MIKSQIFLQEIINALRKDMQPHLLYHPDVSSGRTTTYQFSKDYMELNDVSYTVHTSVCRASGGLVNMIYLEEADKSRTFALSENPSTSISTTLPLTFYVRIYSSYFNHRLQRRLKGTKLVHGITKQLKKEDRFTGKIGEDVNEYIANYIDICNDINVHNDLQLETSIMFWTAKLKECTELVFNQSLQRFQRLVIY